MRVCGTVQLSESEDSPLRVPTMPITPGTLSHGAALQRLEQSVWNDVRPSNAAGTPPVRNP